MGQKPHQHGYEQNETGQVKSHTAKSPAERQVIVFFGLTRTLAMPNLFVGNPLQHGTEKMIKIKRQQNQQRRDQQRHQQPNNGAVSHGCNNHQKSGQPQQNGKNLTGDARFALRFGKPGTNFFF